MTEPQRHDSGPRDWTPGGSGFGSPPFGPPSASDRVPPARRPVNGLRGIGVLALLMGIGSVIVALAPAEIGRSGGSLLLIVAPLATILGAIGVAKRRELNALDRVASAFGAGLGAIGMLGMLAVFTGIWSGLPVDNSTTSFAGPTEFAAQVSPEKDRLSLVQAAGTFSFLANQDAAKTGSFPDLVAASDTGYLILLSGTVQLPAGSSASYVPSANGDSYVLTLTGATGAVAVYDSTVGTIDSFLP